MFLVGLFSNEETYEEEKPVSEEQIIGILKEHQAGLDAKELCRKYGGMEVFDARKLLAEHMVDVSTLKEMLGKTFEDVAFVRHGSEDNGRMVVRLCCGLGHERKTI